MSVSSTSTLTAQIANQVRRRAVLTIATQTQSLLTAGTVDILQSSLAATSLRKPAPGSLAQILTVLA